MPKPFLQFLLCLLFSLGAALASMVRPVHADTLSQGMQLYQAKKYSEAIPLLEKAAKEGNEDALRALDKIYAEEKPAAVTMDDKSSVVKEEPAKRKDEAQPAPVYEKATVTVDPKETEDRSFLRKVLFLGTAVIIVLIWVIQYYLLRRFRNRNFQKVDTTNSTGSNKK